MCIVIHRVPTKVEYNKVFPICLHVHYAYIWTSQKCALSNVRNMYVCMYIVNELLKLVLCSGEPAT